MSRAARPDLHHGLCVAATDVADNANETQFQNPPFHAVRLTGSRRHAGRGTTRNCKASHCRMIKCAFIASSKHRPALDPDHAA
jgi:hypothetical protein